MIVARNRAIHVWERMEQLTFWIVDNENSPKWEMVLDRYNKLLVEMHKHQLAFLAAEDRADTLWHRLTPDQRRSEVVDTLFDVDKGTASLLGRWSAKMGTEVPVPPEDMTIDRDVLHFVSPKQAKAYGGRG
jgi:hypothetical protein